MADCRHCRRDTDLFLCTLCAKELGALLSDLPWLLRQLDITVTRQDKLGTAQVGKSSDNPSPINVGAMELARNLHGQLGTLVRDLCESRGMQVPARKWTTVNLAGWLEINLQAITCSEGAGEVYDEIRSATDAILAAINRTSRMWCGPCTTVVAHDQTGADIECGIDLYADRENLAEQIQCPKCRMFCEPRLQLLNTIKRGDLLPEAKLLEIMDSLGEKVSRNRFYDWIKAGSIRPRGYVHHGRIVAERIRREDLRVFSLSQARQLRWRETEGAA
ncbi:hypothetical protein [Mycolicibacterium sp.]|uniref:hypothetical protein n=1 Tax=Mycolicibacterium sp. TaxID=2320850 RepID=UPI0028AC4814|nr:hypothetical protein [Mycolicibacterium sp.]